MDNIVIQCHFFIPLVFIFIAIKDLLNFIFVVNIAMMIPLVLAKNSNWAKVTGGVSKASGSSSEANSCSSKE
jgi:hypothetical protein